MNQNDRKEFEIVHLKIDGLKEDIEKLNTDMENAHLKTEETLKFIKENLFNPNQGLWAETKQNSQSENPLVSGEVRLVPVLLDCFSNNYTIYSHRL